MKSTEIGNRIIVLGCSGSGKSTFARRLHACTNLPLIHLDNVWWKADRTHISRKEFDHRLEKLLDPELVKLVRNDHKANRPLIYSLIDQYPEKQTVIFKTRSQADDWLNLCTAEREKQKRHSKEV